MFRLCVRVLWETGFYRKFIKVLNGCTCATGLFFENSGNRDYLVKSDCGCYFASSASVLLLFNGG